MRANTEKKKSPNWVKILIKQAHKNISKSVGQILDEGSAKHPCEMTMSPFLLAKSKGKKGSLVGFHMEQFRKVKCLSVGS